MNSMADAEKNEVYNDTDCAHRQYSYIWNIKSFSSSPIQYGRKLRSNTFSFENATCYLEAYNINRPKYNHRLKSSIDIDYLEVDINIDPLTNVLRCVAYFQNKCHDYLYIKRITINNEYESCPFLVLLCESRDIRESVLLNDCLTIVCQLTFPHITQNQRSCEDAAQWKSSKGVEDLLGDFQRFLTSGQNADVCFKVEDQEIPAHSQILSARSPVFASMFQHDMEERKTGKINISDCGPSTMHCLLRYLYTGKILDVKDLSSTLMTELYYVADKYAVNELKMMCLHLMASNLSADNVKMYATLAQKYNDQILIESIVKFFVNNSKMVESDLFNELTEMIPTLSPQVLRALAKRMAQENGKNL